MSLLALGGCGFTPIYGGDSALRGMIAYETQDSVAGFRMRNRFEGRLGQTNVPRYVLAVTQSNRSVGSAISADGDTTRFNLIGQANWTLSDAQTGTQIGTGMVETFAGYATTGSTTATQAATVDAAERLAVALADMIVSRILILSTDLPQ